MNNRVLFLVTSLNGGGLENYLLRFLTYKPSLSAHILCKCGIIGDLEDDYSSLPNVERIHLLNMKGKPISSVIRLYNLYRTYKYTAICDFTGSFAGIPLLVAKHAGIERRIVFYRNSTIPFTPTVVKMVYYGWVKRLTLRYATSILSNSQAAFDNYFGGKRDSRFQVIYNGIDPSFVSSKTKEEMKKYLGFPKESFVIGHTGRYHPLKNHTFIFAVAELLCNKYHDIYFLLIGKDVPKHRPENCNPHIICINYSKSISDLLKCMDLFYFPSLSEGQPNALIEAMVSGLPFVASSIPSITETIPDSLRANLISPTDINANVSCLENLYINRDLLCNYISKDWALQHFNAEKQFQEFYQTLINE